MKAICVTQNRELEVRDIPTSNIPTEPAPGHLLVAMDASAINHGDKTFLKMPNAAGNPLAGGRFDVWGASGAGRVVALGAGVPAQYAGRQVAIYRSLVRSPETIGLWSQTVQVPYHCCLILPEHVRARDYCGSLVNVITAYAFLDEIVEAGHKGVIVTAGNAATGHALAALAARRNVPAILLVRNEAARKALEAVGVKHVIVTADGFTEALGTLAAELGATAVFDGVGGELLSKIAPVLPMNSTVYFYGFLGGATPVSVQTVLFMMRNLSMRRFSNFESRPVKEPARLQAVLKALESVIDDPIFATRIGKTFSYDEIAQAMAYEAASGEKAVLVA